MCPVKILSLEDKPLGQVSNSHWLCEYMFMLFLVLSYLCSQISQQFGKVEADGGIVFTGSIVCSSSIRT